MWHFYPLFCCFISHRQSAGVICTKMPTALHQVHALCLCSSQAMLWCLYIFPSVPINVPFSRLLFSPHTFSGIYVHRNHCVPYADIWQASGHSLTSWFTSNTHLPPVFGLYLPSNDNSCPCPFFFLQVIGGCVCESIDPSESVEPSCSPGFDGYDKMCKTRALPIGHNQ